MALRNNIKGSVKAFICGALIANLSVGAMISANAKSSATSQTISKTVNGVNYSYNNIISTGSDSNGMYATAGTSVGSGKASAAGMMGARPHLYDDRSGLIIKSGEWKYNNSNVYSILNTVTVRNYLNPPPVYSYGEVKLWNGYDYNTEKTLKTPSINDYTSN